MPEASVTEKTAGTTPELEGQKSPEGKGEIPAAESVSSEKTFTEADVRAAVHAARSEAGRERSAVEKERNELKSQLTSIHSELEEKAAELEKLQTQFDGLSSDDPEKFELVKEIKAVKEERRQLKADRTALEADKTKHGERIKFADDTLREVAIFDISAEYEAGNAEKLKDLCDIFSATSEEQIRHVADTLWQKKGTGTKPTLKLDSGGTGGALTNKQIMEDFIKDPYNLVNKQRYLEMRAKQGSP